jgi:HD superfamily phosphohydrolase
MQICDFLYGTFEIDGVLAELIDSRPVQRLKGIHQGGACYLVNPEWNVTRYEHSVGVMLLIRLLGGSVEEQIAGLLHDVSHTAFSHVVDTVFQKADEDYHEEIFEKVIEQSEIPAILQRHGYDHRDILLDHSQWRILEQSAPDLCADRLDYTLRDVSRYGWMPTEEARAFVSTLRFHEGKVCTSTLEAAEWFTEAYYKLVIDFFLHPLNLYSYEQLAAALRLALEKGLLSRADLLLEDEQVLQKLRGYSDSDVTRLLDKLHPQVQVEANESDFDFSRKNKLRLIDPLVLTDSGLQRASELSSRVKAASEAAYAKATRGTCVKVLSTARPS